MPANTTDTPDPVPGTDEDRYVERRAQFIASTTDVGRPAADALALREIGYSPSGIAKRIDRTEGTVKGYLQEAADELGHDVLDTKLPDEIQVNAKVGG